MVRFLKRYFISLVLELGFLWFISGCKPAVVVTQVKPEVAVPKTEVVIFMMPGDSNNSVYTELNHSEAVFQFYKERRFELLWLKDSVPAMTDSLMKVINGARYYGLLPQDYHAVTLKGMSAKPLERSQRYRMEALLSDAFVSLSLDLKYGRLNPGYLNSAGDSLKLVLLERAAVDRKGSVRTLLESQEPEHQQYQLLKNSLHRLLVTADTTNLRLFLSGSGNDSMDGYRQIRSVEINMERWRWEPNGFGDRYVWINIPSYMLKVVHNSRNVLESRVIVGKPDTPTPALASAIESISFYPYWHVPRKIAVEEFLPVIKDDTSFLRRSNFEVLGKNGTVLDPATLDWKKYNEDYFPVSLRQREGRHNSLGIIKFVFDNPYAVFLHDTNAKGLFRNSVRALSHGCVRMEKAEELAKYLVPEPGRIDKQIELKMRAGIVLRKPVPIFIRYFTCEYLNDTLLFYEDIYGLDNAIIQALYLNPRTRSSHL